MVLKVYTPVAGFTLVNNIWYVGSELLMWQQDFSWLRPAITTAAAAVYALARCPSGDDTQCRSAAGVSPEDGSEPPGGGSEQQLPPPDPS